MSVALTIMVALALWASPTPADLLPSSDTDEPNAQAREPKRKVQELIDDYLRRDPEMAEFFDNSAGYAVLPHVGKGGFIIGAAHGEGELIERGRGATGEANLTQVTYGLQFGGQDYSQIVFLETPVDVERFKSGDVELAANIGIVFVTLGAAATNDYQDGVAVFVHTNAGAMYEATLGGQGFEYNPY